MQHVFFLVATSGREWKWTLFVLSRYNLDQNDGNQTRMRRSISWHDPSTQTIFLSGRNTLRSTRWPLRFFLSYLSWPDWYLVRHLKRDSDVSRRARYSWLDRVIFIENVNTLWTRSTLFSDWKTLTMVSILVRDLSRGETRKCTLYGSRKYYLYTYQNIFVNFINEAMRYYCDDYIRKLWNHFKDIYRYKSHKTFGVNIYIIQNYDVTWIIFKI